ncbi:MULTISPECIES: LacI family DNA-binding transcriptional regulator [unclassified Actinomyces]|uniref:LacI family DNA-binding transcriptional regulator n=1 Tax=unclassified Actinomyces TaxID=2609248 RepID=UPI002017CD9B|nr:MULTISPECIES: LacI family DNA-binding transcriptional regulator [unclassified Actinomyces]MCL3778312.1 LacI family DNA-binding transcriptional regulator [Actinomyces sp. AC-20-1]MCL3788774.1 LacI family DNA-binding transcriptional regulator [Actinomyces sp. 187325]MCL3791642.1 LacI family DNA-binding transcriptional regulator [Actinomyces sp. 186855]MCL3794305.1 LacI family DNA-binding transcriptional regulator [Actinomyces sp. 217892]
MAGRRVTQADVARRAGVSRSLVSRVLQGLDKVSDDKRERVLAAVRELGYIDNGMATALAGNRHGRLVGFFPQELSNALFGEVYDALKVGLEGKGYSLVVVEGSWDVEQEDWRLRQLAGYSPDCIVVAGYAGSTDALTAAAHSIPIVSVTRRISQAGVRSVYNDDHAGAMLATRHLVDLGHRRIAHLQLPPDIPYEERAAGYTEAMRRARLAPEYIIPRLATRESAYAAVRVLCEAGDVPTAIFCGSDHMALGAMEALRSAGLSVPDDVSLVGYDDQLMARLVGLTTIHQAASEQGKVAAGFVHALVEAGDIDEAGEDGSGTGEAGRPRTPFQQVIAPTLIVRSSSAPPRG